MNAFNLKFTQVQIAIEAEVPINPFTHTNTRTLESG
jgi:hypothetical protein